jgi:hypothetical protein
LTAHEPGTKTKREPVPSPIATGGAAYQPIADPPSEPQNPELPPLSCPSLVAKSLNDADHETAESSPPSVALKLTHLRSGAPPANSVDHFPSCDVRTNRNPQVRENDRRGFGKEATGYR